ncbi:MAG: GNAT family N-acetyltransferase [Pseudolabrys sp.]
MPDGEINMVRDNPALSRFELDADGHVAFNEYTLEGNVLTLRHTEVPKALEGRGIGSRLAKEVLDLARSRGLKVVPRCPFINSWIGKHPDYADLVA